MADQPTVLACDHCNVALIPIQKKAQVSVAGVFSVLLFIVGLIVCAANLVAGIVVIALAILVSVTGRAKYTAMTCPSCGKVGSTFRV